jgi:hypothetical protein
MLQSLLECCILFTGYDSEPPASVEGLPAQAGVGITRSACLSAGGCCFLQACGAMLRRSPSTRRSSKMANRLSYGSYGPYLRGNLPLCRTRNAADDAPTLLTVEPASCVDCCPGDTGFCFCRHCLNCECQCSTACTALPTCWACQVCHSH